MSLSIKTKVLNNDLQGEGYFHPKPTYLPDNIIAMTLQTIKGSDFFGPVQITYSKNNGNSWLKPEYVPTLGWNRIRHGINEAVCDVVPDYHKRSGKLLAIGHNAYYSDTNFVDTLGLFKQKEKKYGIHILIIFWIKCLNF